MSRYAEIKRKLYYLFENHKTISLMNDIMPIFLNAEPKLELDDATLTVMQSMIEVEMQTQAVERGRFFTVYPQFKISGNELIIIDMTYDLYAASIRDVEYHFSYDESKND